MDYPALGLKLSAKASPRITFSDVLNDDPVFQITSFIIGWPFAPTTVHEHELRSPFGIQEAASGCT